MLSGISKHKKPTVFNLHESEAMVFSYAQLNRRINKEVTHFDGMIGLQKSWKFNLFPPQIHFISKRKMVYSDKKQGDKGGYKIVI